jgi:hypothetical protein
MPHPAPRMRSSRSHSGRRKSSSVDLARVLPTISVTGSCVRAALEVTRGAQYCTGIGQLPIRELGFQRRGTKIVAAIERAILQARR